MTGVRGFSCHGRPLVIGHRGLRRPGVPENTLDAFRAAADEGAEAVELDARVCASGEAVVLHDPDLARVTEERDRRHVADLSLAELARVELGADRTARVPTLAEVLAFARERRLGVNVELKHDAPSRGAIARAAARLLDAWDPAHAILVSSFDPVALGTFAALAPRVPRAILVHRTRYHLLHIAVGAPLGVSAVHLARTLTRPDLVRAIRARGVAVHVWTVNDAREAKDLAALGVDALISDAPGDVRAALDA